MKHFICILSIISFLTFLTSSAARQTAVSTSVPGHIQKPIIRLLTVWACLVVVVR